MIRIIDLQTALLELLYEIRNTGEKLIVGGGYPAQPATIASLGIKRRNYTGPSVD